MQASGFVTAGGQSKRMGTDKAWLEIDGRPMIEHVIEALKPVTTSVSIIANNPEYQRLGLPIYADDRSGVGPLEAVRTALANSTEHLVVLAACDLPFVTPALFDYLIKSANDYDIVVPTDESGLLEPLCAVYSRDCLQAVRAMIDAGVRKVSALFERGTTRLVAFEEVQHLPGSENFFRNVNTPSEYSSVVRTLRG